MPKTQDMLRNLSEAFPALQNLIFVSAWVFGLFLVGRGLMELLIRHRQGRRILSSVACMIAGSLLLSIAETMEVLTASLFVDEDPRRIFSVVPHSDLPSRALMHTVLDFLALLGWIAGVRGLWWIANAGDHRAQNQVAKGISHLFGGVLLINLTPFAQAIGVQLGIEFHVNSILGVAV
ncbi:MAG: hypothetical protein ACYYK0_04365 [Candidatus Eutrophobiaceae bacterium]